MDEKKETKAENIPPPLLTPYSKNVQEGDHVLLLFNNGHRIFAHAVKKWKGKSAPVKINKRTYSTANLIGLPFGTVLELGPKGLIPLPLGENLTPKTLSATELVPDTKIGNGENMNTMENDNRNLLDNNTSQSITQPELHKMQKEGTHGSEIVAALISNSATFHTKSQFSQDKYIRKKQQKYQLRCRMVRPDAGNICTTYFLKDARKVMNMREDTLAQILSYGNIYAGCQALVMEDCMGILTGALAQRMGGYGTILSIYTGMGPSYVDLLSKFNLTFGEQQTIKWVHSGEIFGHRVQIKNEQTAIESFTSDSKTEKKEDTASSKSNTDWEKYDREILKWPCPLKDHTRNYLKNMPNNKDREAFLLKRAQRFTRKLTRPTTLENRTFLHQQSDCLIIATKFDPKATLLQMFPFLAPSCPFVILCEHMEPLVECFTELQEQKIAINLRLSDTWMREFQVLPGRTHPNMNMGQHGGFLLTGIKVCPEHGINELSEEEEKRIRAEIGGRRGKKKIKRKENIDTSETTQETPDAKKVKVQ